MALGSLLFIDFSSDDKLEQVLRELYIRIQRLVQTLLMKSSSASLVVAATPSRPLEETKAMTPTTAHQKPITATIADAKDSTSMVASLSNWFFPPPPPAKKISLSSCSASAVAAPLPPPVLVATGGNNHISAVGVDVIRCEERPALVSSAVRYHNIILFTFALIFS